MRDHATTTVPATPEELGRLLAELVRIPSVNPRDGAPGMDGHTGEAAVADHVEAWLADRGIPHTRQPVAAGHDTARPVAGRGAPQVAGRGAPQPVARRENVLGLVDVGAPDTLVLETHMDTVEAGDHASPFEPVITDGVLHGRGACDAKGSLVAMAAALAALHTRRDGLAVNVVLAAVVDEEHQYAGVRALVDHPWLARARWAIVGEPTELDVVSAHKGCMRCTVRVTGRAAHSSRPEAGRNAIALAADVVRHLESTADALPRHPLVGPATLVVTRIAGGEGPNLVPGTCAVDIDRRTLPGEDPDALWRDLKRDLAARFGPEVTCDPPFTVDFALPPPASQDLVRTVLAASAGTGHPAVERGVSYGTDASKLARAGMDAVVLGPGSIDDAHTAHETVRLADVARAARVIEATARALRPRATAEGNA